MSTTRVPLNAGNHGPKFDVLGKSATSIQTAPQPVTQNLPGQQVITTASVVFTIALEAFGAAGLTQDVPFLQDLGLPTIQLTRQATGLITVDLDLATQPDDCIVTFSKQLAYGGKSPSNTWSLPPGITIGGAKVSGIARVLSTAATGAQTLTVLVTSKVFGIPPAP